MILPEKFQVIQEYRLVLYAALVILILLFRPEGLLPRQLRDYVPGAKRAARTLSCRGARAMSAALLGCKGVTCRFGGLVALARVDFEVNDGEIVGLIGPNGSGKTTLFNVVTGIYGADEGAVTVRGHGHDRRDAAGDLSRGRDPDLPALAHVPAAVGVRQHHGRQPQAAEPRPRVQPAAARRVRRRARAQPRGGARAGEGVQPPSLPTRIEEPAAGLPMIDRRRIEICRALISRPRLVLLDEPSAGMTHEETRHLMDDILSVRERLPGLTIVIIEHEMGVIERVTDRCVVLNYGRKIKEGTFAEVAGDRQVQEAYLGVA